MICKNCGYEIPKREEKCPNCGFNESKGDKVNTGEILITAEEVHRLLKLQLWKWIAVLSLGVVMLFVPLFKDGDSYFSYFTELILVLAQLIGGAFGEIFSPFSNFIFLLCFFMTVGSIIGLIKSGLSHIIKTAKGMKKIEALRLQYYQRNVKYNNDSLLMHSSVDVFFAILCVILDGFFALGSTMLYRQMSSVWGGISFENFSILFILVIPLAVMYYVFKHKTKVCDRQIREELALRRKAQKKAQKEKNRQENEAAHRRNLEKKKAAEAAEATDVNNINNDGAQKEALAEEDKEVVLNEEVKAEQDEKSKQEDLSTSKQKETIALLKEYKSLLDSGVITEEEFEAKKKELLG